MSESSIDEAQLLQLYQYGLIGNYVMIMAMSLFVYDSIISFNREWQAVWSRKIMGATAIYLALRYVTLVNVIASVVNYIITSCTSCGTYIAQAAFASIRVYAIDGRRWTKAVIVMMLGIVPVAINIYGTSQTIVTYAAQFCINKLSISTSKYNILLLVSRICILVSNLLVVISTWQATCASRAVTALNSRGSLTAVLFRDGTVHFALVVGLNAANLVFTLLLGVGFSNPDANNSSMSSHASSFSSFASRIIGNLGEMLEDDPQAPDDDLEGELDGINDAEDVDGALDLDDSAKHSSDADKAPTQTATMAVLEQETHEGGAANREFPEAQDEGFSQSVIDIV
ncbi:predicted protein [Postia placenta Mad-698-R]|nr:predicted protein [Postia placenta Mad-698-R]